MNISTFGLAVAFAVACLLRPTRVLVVVPLLSVPLALSIVFGVLGAALAAIGSSVARLSVRFVDWTCRLGVLVLNFDAFDFFAPRSGGPE